MDNLNSWSVHIYIPIIFDKIRMSSNFPDPSAETTTGKLLKNLKVQFFLRKLLLLFQLTYFNHAWNFSNTQRSFFATRVIVEQTCLRQDNITKTKWNILTRLFIDNNYWLFQKIILIIILTYTPTCINVCYDVPWQEFFYT